MKLAKEIMDAVYTVLSREIETEPKTKGVMKQCQFDYTVMKSKKLKRKLSAVANISEGVGYCKGVNQELVRIHKILDDEEAQLQKQYDNEMVSITLDERLKASIATIRKIREMI